MTCSAGIKPSLSQRCSLEGVISQICATSRIVTIGPSGGAARAWKRGILRWRRTSSTVFSSVRIGGGWGVAD